MAELNIFLMIEYFSTMSIHTSILPQCTMARVSTKLGMK